MLANGLDNLPRGTSPFATPELREGLASWYERAVTHAEAPDDVGLRLVRDLAPIPAGVTPFQGSALLDHLHEQAENGLVRITAPGIDGFTCDGTELRVPNQMASLESGMTMGAFIQANQENLRRWVREIEVDPPYRVERPAPGHRVIVRDEERDDEPPFLPPDNDPCCGEINCGFTADNTVTLQQIHRQCDRDPAGDCTGDFVPQSNTFVYDAIALTPTGNCGEFSGTVTTYTKSSNDSCPTEAEARADPDSTRTADIWVRWCFDRWQFKRSDGSGEWTDFVDSDLSTIVTGDCTGLVINSTTCFPGDSGDVEWLLDDALTVDDGGGA